MSYSALASLYALMARPRPVLGRAPKPKKVYVCKHCGERFIPQSSQKTVFCSPECYKTYYKK